MTKIATIRIFRGCDSQVESAINAFARAWGPYSAKSRSLSIFRLIDELVGPVWMDFCQRTPALNSEELNRLWSRYMFDRVDRGLNVKDLPVNGKFSLSSLAKHIGLDELDWFFKATARYIAEGNDDVIPTLDSMRNLAIACRGKRPKRQGKLRLLPDKERCRYCEQPTERAISIARDDDSGLRHSSLYCTSHKPRKVTSDTVCKKYQKARRKQEAFDQELERLDCQSWAGTNAAHAKSGNQLVDEYILRLSVHRSLTYEQQVDGVVDLEMRLRLEARQMVDLGITDRKKEIVVLLCSGITQTEAAKQLRQTRQAISKALKSIPSDYRLDL